MAEKARHAYKPETNGMSRFEALRAKAMAWLGKRVAGQEFILPNRAAEPLPHDWSRQAAEARGDHVGSEWLHQQPIREIELVDGALRSPGYRTPSQAQEGTAWANSTLEEAGAPSVQQQEGERFGRVTTDDLVRRAQDEAGPFSPGVMGVSGATPESHTFIGDQPGNSGKGFPLGPAVPSVLNGRHN